MDLTAEQITNMAPDPASLAAGKKLSNSPEWREVAQNQEVLWGLCQGSALYQVCIELSAYGYKCTCPSRKFPCKHVLGLLFMAAQKGAAIAAGTPPDWVSEWLQKKVASSAKKEEKKKAEAEDPKLQAKRAEDQAKRAEKREKNVGEGLDQLDQWLADIARNGLANPQLESPRYWEEQAARMTDYQAPGIASRLRRIGIMVGASKEWHERVLDRLGGLALLTHSFRRLDHLPQGLQADVRQLIGWNYKEEEVLQHNDKVSDRWFVAGQILDEVEQVRLQRTWLYGERSQRPAVVLQFSVNRQPFAEMFAVGTCYQGELAFWPGAYPLRAKFIGKSDNSPFAGTWPGHDNFAAFFAAQSKSLAALPWLDQFPCLLRQARLIVLPAAPWHIQDAAGEALPLVKKDHWKLLAVTGGHPFDLAGEWDGYELSPLVVRSGETLTVL